MSIDELLAYSPKMAIKLWVHALQVGVTLYFELLLLEDVDVAVLAVEVTEPPGRGVPSGSCQK
jgi:hypothetical protein